MEWQEKYNIHTAKIDLVSLTVAWDNVDYKVIINGGTLKRRFRDIKPAKLYAIRTAIMWIEKTKRLLAQALEEEQKQEED